MINLSVSSQLTNDQIENAILDAVAKNISKAFQQSVAPIKKRIGDLCHGLILQSPTYANLINGQLLGELGVPNISNKIKDIISAIENSIEVAYQPIIRRGKDLTGGLIINILKSDFSDVLTLSAATYDTDKGVTIQWLDWLLTQGDRIIVVGYDVDFSLSPNEKLRSRTGLALMQRGVGWRVPPGFSGTKESNFLTKAFRTQDIASLLSDIIEEEINSRI